MRHRIYNGERDEDSVTVTVTEAGVTRELDPEPSRALRNHSPTGFEWGYGGSGPAQLSLAILLDHFTGALEGEPSKAALGSPENSAQHYYQNFKFRVIGGLPKDKWQLTTLEIEHHLHVLKERDNG